MSWRRPRLWTAAKVPGATTKLGVRVETHTQDIAETHWKSFYNNWKCLWSLPNKLPWTTFPISHCSRQRPPALRSLHYGSWSCSGYPVRKDLKGIPYGRKHSLPNSETVLKTTKLRSAKYTSHFGQHNNCQMRCNIDLNYWLAKNLARIGD